jgi:HSP20 family molecular chaperone IbpA
VGSNPTGGTKREPGYTLMEDIKMKALQKSRISSFPGFLNDSWMSNPFEGSLLSHFDEIFKLPELSTSLYELDGSYIFQIPVSGIDTEKVDISVEGRVVTIRAPYQHSVPEGAKVLWNGLPTGSLLQIFTVPAAIDSEKSEATYDNGILTITMPKSEQSHKITVR